MSKEKKINVAKALTIQLHAVEEAIDTALSESANLVEACISSRRAVRLSTIVGTDVHMSTLKAMAALTEAQAHMSATHAALLELQNNMGITALLAPINDKPPLGMAAAQPLEITRQLHSATT